MTTTSSATVRREIDVDAPIERAVRVITDRFGQEARVRVSNLIGSPPSRSRCRGRLGPHRIRARR
jgi:hypothetical protein